MSNKNSVSGRTGIRIAYGCGNDTIADAMPHILDDCEIDIYRSAERLVDGVRAGGYDAVVTGSFTNRMVQMPEKTGLKAIKEIRAFDPEIPIIMLTGGFWASSREALEAGANDYVQLPEVGEFRKVVHKYTDSVHQAV